MPSIIEGYSYDIFISYRQNDNKYDGWVTEFVDNLNKELEANIKDKISVYFDINPHDGLLETYSVDRSLEDKLKCLIFIPIISRTYCDSKSFAWQHEFCAFNKLAREDMFGRDIRLSSGNVTSRILPVKIHDLDPEDKILLENELGGVLRSIEFIYKSAGVNRPLRANEDHPQDNLNKTYYRDQINKVANSLKEIITALKKQNQQVGKVQSEVVDAIPEKPGNIRAKIIAGSLILLILIVLGYFFVPKLFKSSEEIEKSIAVLPFKYLGDEPDKQYLADGMMDAVLLHLSKIQDLRVLDRTSVEQYRGTTKTTFQISKELDVTYLLEGSFQKHEDNVRLIVQLIKASEKGHVWADEFNSKWQEIFSVQSKVAQTIAGRLNAVISPEEKHLIEKIPTENLEAYDYYLLGEYLRGQRTPEALWKAKTFYEKSINADPEFVRAYSGLAHCYGNLAFWTNLRPAEAYPPALDLAYKALELDSLSSEAYIAIGMVEIYYNFDFISAEKNYKRALELDPANLQAYRIYSELLFFKGEYSEAIEMDRRAMEIDPILVVNNSAYGAHLYYTHQKDSAIAHLTSLAKLSEHNLNYHLNLAIIYFQEGEYEKSIDELKKTLTGFSPVSMTYLGLVYSKSGNLDETKRILDTLEYRAKSEFVPYSMRGVLMAELGREKEALNYLRKGFDEREEFLLLLTNVDTISFSNLRNNPEFVEIMRKIRVE